MPLELAQHPEGLLTVWHVVEAAERRVAALRLVLDAQRADAVALAQLAAAPASLSGPAGVSHGLVDQRMHALDRFVNESQD